MPDSTSQDPSENQPSKQETVDLSALQSFSFGTQWSPASKPSESGGRSDRRSGGRPDRRSGGGAPRKDRRPARAPRGQDSGERSQGPRDGQDSGERRPRRGGPRSNAPRTPAAPYESDVFEVHFYPEDNCFAAIIKAMRANHLTYELFQVAKLFMEKPDRYIASITRKAEGDQKPAKVFICAADSMPFVSEQEAFAHVMAKHADTYFSIEEVEVDPPSGTFNFVNRCPFTKELLGPPNYHKYETTLREHHQSKLPNMSFEKLQSSIETVREEEAVNQWLESQKKATRYTVKNTPEGEEPTAFDSYDEALAHLRSSVGEKAVKEVNYARVLGSTLEANPQSEAAKAAQGERERQQRFPLDTANAIRGRMRREKFSIYKKGSKGVTYVCSVKRNFRTPGQVMAPDLDRLIRFVESKPGTLAKELFEHYKAWLAAEGIEGEPDEKKVQRDLHWLVADGYISHLEDDSLLAQPVLDPASNTPKKAAVKKPKAEPEAANVAATEAEAAAEPEGEPASSEEAPAAEETTAAAAATSETEPEAKEEDAKKPETPAPENPSA